jgi:2-C-methyl-D-erythritol 4-phosphate cytidylyltransferase
MRPARGFSSVRGNRTADKISAVSRAYALIPAAGAGARMGGATPKQYLDVAGRPLLWHALRVLCGHPRIEHVFLVVAAGDTLFARHDWRDFSARLTPLYCGGDTRAASVFNGLLAVRDLMAEADWILVHDAVRPCLRSAEIDRLLTVLSEDDTGGLLAVPVTDTLKRASGDARVVNTAPRHDLWLAQTPQMFRYWLLLEALRKAEPGLVTDEASAIEALGLQPKLVTGDPRNIKVTYPEDLALADLILKSQTRD